MGERELCWVADRMQRRMWLEEQDGRSDGERLATATDIVACLRENPAALLYVATELFGELSRGLKVEDLHERVGGLLLEAAHLRAALATAEREREELKAHVAFLEPHIKMLARAADTEREGRIESDKLRATAERERDEARERVRVLEEAADRARVVVLDYWPDCGETDYMCPCNNCSGARAVFAALRA